MMFSSLHPGRSRTGSIQYNFIDNVNDYMAFRYISDGSQITGVNLMGGVYLGTPDNLEVVLVGEVSGVPGATDLGSTLVTITPATWTGGYYQLRTVTFSSPYTPSAGEVLYCLIRPSGGGTLDTSNRWLVVHNRSPGQSNSASREDYFSSTDGGSTWSAAQHGIANISWLGASGVGLRSFNYCGSSNSIASGFNNSSNPDEHGIVLTQDSGLAWKLYGLVDPVWPAANTSDYDINIYTGSSVSSFTLESTISIDVSADRALAYQTLPYAHVWRWLDTPITVADGDQLRVTFKATGTTNLNMDWHYFGNQACKDGFIPYNHPVVNGCTRNNGTGNFTDNALSMPVMSLLMKPVVPAGGGGGLLTHPGMSGGMRG